MAGTRSSPSPQNICILSRALRQRHRCLLAKFWAEERSSLCTQAGVWRRYSGAFKESSTPLITSKSLPWYQQTEGESSRSCSYTRPPPSLCLAEILALGGRVHAAGYPTATGWKHTRNVPGRIQPPSQGSLCRSGSSEGQTANL